MRADVAASFGWQARFIPQMKGIVGRYLVAEGTPEQDGRQNTDLIILRLDGEVRVACRVRGYEQYRKRYGDEFTIRCDRPSGAPTELAKLLNGWGDYLLYGFARQRNPYATPARFVPWTLARLDVFRRCYRPGMGRRRNNHDGSSAFLAFRWSDFPAEFVIATDRTQQQGIA
jgi:hypothetical protein